MDAEPDFDPSAESTSSGIGQFQSEEQADVREAFRRARHRSVAWLSRREYATGEMQLKLTRAEFSDDIVQQTMQWLMTNDLISNQRFSEAFCRRRASQGYGPLRVLMEMRQRGVPGSLAQTALKAITWQDSAEHAWQKRFKSQPPDSAKERAKQQKYLAQRGFSHDIIRLIIQ